jgi:type I restriction enzyme M protein
MVRLSLVNLYLHGFVQPQIYEYDTLTSEDRWNEYADVILANPPFMSPKGGIIPHKRFSVQSKRSEVLFVDYIAEHLTPTGRAAVIVPEGIIFQSAKAYMQLRKMLVEKYLYAVVSLPAGVFNPYSGVKTSILLMNRQIAAKASCLLFIKVENDGFDLGAQRRAIDRNDLPAAAEILAEYRRKVFAEQKQPSLSFQKMMDRGNALIVPKETIARNGEYNLTGERYRVVERRGKQKWPMVKLGDVCSLITDTIEPHNHQGTVEYIGLENIESNSGKLIGKTLTSYTQIKSLKNIFSRHDILYGKLRPTLNKVYFSQFSGVCSTDIIVLRAKEIILPALLDMYLRSDVLNQKIIKGVIGAQLPRVKFEYMANLPVPLPPLEIQQEIVAEIEGYQKIIDGARQVVDNWKPRIEVDPVWPVVKLGDAPVQIIDGDRGENYPKKEDFSPQGYCLFLNTSNVRNGFFNFDDTQFITKQKDSLLRKGKLIRGDIVLTTRGTLGNIAFYNDDIPYDNVRINSGMLLLRADAKEFSHLFIVQYFLSYIAVTQIKKILSGSAQPQLPIRSLIEFKIPLPPLAIQQEIVANIESERKIIDGCRELIVKYEEKIKKVMNGVWGE